MCARRYLKKGIAEWSSLPEQVEQWTPEEIKEGAKCIRLLFQHSGSTDRDTTSPESVYLRSVKRNICASCGDDGHHMRHYIVPYAYRSLLPSEYKSHMSHDICILCPECHSNCERQSKRRMKQMEHELRTKLGPDYSAPATIEDPILYHVRSCALALVKSRERMPLERIKEYEVVVREYLASTREKEERQDMLDSEEELTKAELETACAVNHKVKNPNYVSGSVIVVQNLNGDAQKIKEFIIQWRKHFIATVNPRHMPNGWRVDNPVASPRVCHPEAVINGNL